MNVQEIIPKIESLVEQVCKKESNVYGYGIWTQNVVNLNLFE